MIWVNFKEKWPITFRSEGGHSENRVVHAADATGWEVENVMVKMFENIQICSFEHHFAMDYSPNIIWEKK